MLFQFGYGYRGGFFQQAIWYMEQLGLLDVILPFILVFAIIYAVLQRVQIFKDTPRVNVIVSLAISALVVVPHVIRPSPNDFVNILNRALPEVGIIAIAVVLVLLLTGLMAPPGEGGVLQVFAGSAQWIALAAVVLVFIHALRPQIFPNWLQFLSDPFLFTLVIGLLLFGLIFRWITGPSPPQPGHPREPAAGLRIVPERRT